MSIAVRFLTGAAIGFDIAPVTGCYLIVYIAMFEIAFFNPELIEIEDDE